MAVYVFGVVFGDVADEIPGVDAASITATTEPISTGNLTQWIEDGASHLNTLLARSGMEASAAMDETVHARLAAAVKYYAVQQALLVLGVSGAPYDQAREVWEQTYAEIQAKPQNLGGEYAPTVTTNIDTISTDFGTEEWSYIGGGFGAKENW